jgi:hypothetical protein
MRLIVDTYQLHHLVKVFDWGAMEMNGITKAYIFITTFKYFLLLYAFGFWIGLKRGVLREDLKNDINYYSLVYTITLSLILIYPFIQLMVWLLSSFQQYPVISISTILIFISLIATKSKLNKIYLKRSHS